MTTPQTITRAQVPAYTYATPDVADTIAKGRHSKVHYNGLVLNELLRPDRYYITEIDGLGGPDIRDNREPRPAQHGEIPYDAFWGGNTMTITGYIEAGNLAQATRMERDLSAAFGSLVEAPMKFNWWDIRDEFSDAQTSRAYWQILSGAASFPGDGTMRFAAATQTIYGLRQYIDHAITTRVVLPLITGDLQIGVMAKCTTTSNYVLLSLSKTALTLTADTVSATGSFTAAPGVSYWLQLLCVDDTVTGYLYEQDPSITNSAPTLTVGPIALGGTIAQKYGYLQQGFAGLFVQGTSQLSSALVEDFRVDALWPSDFVQNVRPLSTPSIQAVLPVSRNKYKQNFQMIVRASNPRWTSPLMQTLSSLVSGTPAQVLDVVNRGNFNALPIITIGSSGGSSPTPTLVNLSNGTFITLDTTIADGDFIVIDSAANTLNDQFNADVFEFFDPTSVFVQLRPGVNRLQLTSTVALTHCYMTVSWANTWK